MADFGLSPYDAGVLVADQETAHFYETVAKGRDAKLAANWLISELFGALNKAGVDILHSPVSAEALGGLVDLIADNTISGRIAKDVFAEMVETGKDAAAIVEAEGPAPGDRHRRHRRRRSIRSSVQHADKLAEYRSGKEKLFGFFIGQVMKATAGKANPAC
jgi:Asp-tRNAAsn/Glu-tRNAGln amidotransferase B subunit (PET112 homolog)